MKAADAKAPNFDSKWWAQNKASAADADRGLEKALTEYSAAKAKFQNSAKNGKVTTGEVDNVRDALKKVLAQAKTKKGDAKLGVLQKDTKEALANYEKLSQVAIKDLDAVSGLPVLTMNALDLIRKVPQFEKYCKLEYSSENFNFVSLMLKKPKKERFIYDDFISPSAKNQVNLPSPITNKFGKVLEAIKADPVRYPDSPETWDKAPWDEAAAAIVKLMDGDTKVRFRAWVVGQATKTTKLP